MRRATDWIKSWYGVCNGDERAIDISEREDEERSRDRGGKGMSEFDGFDARQGIRSCFVHNQTVRKS